MTTYRRSKNADADAPWHFCRDCSNDPKADYDVRYDQPAYAELCYECKTGKVEPSRTAMIIEMPKSRWLQETQGRKDPRFRRYLEAA